MLDIEECRKRGGVTKEIVTHTGTYGTAREVCCTLEGEFTHDFPDGKGDLLESGPHGEFTYEYIGRREYMPKCKEKPGEITWMGVDLTIRQSGLIDSPIARLDPPR